MYKEPPTRLSSYHQDVIETTDTHVYNIVQATEQNIGDIIKLRGLPGEGCLRPLSHEEIEQKIHEFYIAIMNDGAVGCCRIMESHNIYELGSLVSSQKGVGNELITFAEGFAQTQGALIMAITRSEKLSSILKDKSWMHANDLYPQRLMKSAPNSELWLYL